MTLNGWALSVDEAKLADWLTLYPNPVTDKLYLKINESPGKDLQVTILDLWGKVVRQGGAENVAGPVYQLDMSAVPCGMYMVKVSDGNREVIRKTIKQ
ncbi:MAG: T9SS type A sorting domain-containing protein [Bacteroidota bacterium]